MQTDGAAAIVSITTRAIKINVVQPAPDAHLLLAGEDSGGRVIRHCLEGMHCSA